MIIIRDRNRDNAFEFRAYWVREFNRPNFLQGGFFWTIVAKIPWIWIAVFVQFHDDYVALEVWNVQQENAIINWSLLKRFRRG